MVYSWTTLCSLIVFVSIVTCATLKHSSVEQKDNLRICNGHHGKHIPVLLHQRALFQDSQHEIDDFSSAFHVGHRVVRSTLHNNMSLLQNALIPNSFVDVSNLLHNSQYPIMIKQKLKVKKDVVVTSINSSLHPMGNNLSMSTIQPNTISHDTLSSIIKHKTVLKPIPNQMELQFFPKTKIPQFTPEFVSNFLSFMPPEKLGGMISMLTGSLDASFIFDIFKNLPPDSVETVFGSLSPELVANITKMLTSHQLQAMMTILPKSLIGSALSKIPKDILIELASTLDTDTMMHMMDSLQTEQLIEVLSILPSEVIVNVGKSQPPEQMMKLLHVLLTKNMDNLTEVISADMMRLMVSSVPVNTLLKIAMSMPLKDLIEMTSQLYPEQMASLVQRIFPLMLEDIDKDQINSVVKALSPSIILKALSHIDKSVVVSLFQKLIPPWKKFLMEKMHIQLQTVAENTTVAFQQCLADVGIVMDAMFDLNEWAFHFFDASGKPARGVLQGNVHLIGNFDQCRAIQKIVDVGSGDGHVISGSYCHVPFMISDRYLSSVHDNNVLPMPELAWDLCAPMSCESDHILQLLHMVPMSVDITVLDVHCQHNQGLFSTPVPLLICVAIFILVIISFVGTTLDIVNKHRHYIVCKKNNKSLENTVTYDAMTGNIDCSFVNVDQQSRKDCSADAKKQNSSNSSNEVFNSLTTVSVPSKLTDCGDKAKDMYRPCECGLSKVHCLPMIEGNGGEKFAQAINVSNQQSVYSDKSIASQSISVHLEEEKAVWWKVFVAFSLVRNIELVTGCCSTNSDMVNYQCLHGIRVLSMLWIIVSNCSALGAMHFENLRQAADLMTSFFAQIFFNSSLPQDSFFTMSGFVTSITFLTVVTREQGLKKNDMIYFYLHRLVRIVPAYWTVVVVYAGLVNFMFDGPHWPPPNQQYCSQQWWTHLLFVNNYFTSIDNMCMPWSWFLANLMQFHIIAPCILLPFIFGRTFIACVVVCLLVLIHVVSTAVLEIGVNGDVLRRQTEYFWAIYQQPWCRVAPYAMGLGLGLFLHRRRSTLSLSKGPVLVGWILAVVVSSTLCFVTFSENRHLMNHPLGWSMPIRSLHESIQRPLWSAVICWIIFACSTGNGGQISTGLSWKWLVPFSRLTFCVYLLHPIIILCDLYSARVYAYFTINYQVIRCLGYIVVSYILALPLSLLMEWPPRALEKLLCPTSQ